MRTVHKIALGLFGGQAAAPPVADFAISDTSGDSPLGVEFYDTSTGGAGTSWLWEYDDGGGWTTFSTSQNPAQSFTTGVYAIRMTVTNSGGSDTYTVADAITVGAPYFITLSIPPADVNVAYSVTGYVGGSLAVLTETTGNLPVSMTFTDNEDGSFTIAGTETDFQTVSITVQAVNAVDTVTQNYTLAIHEYSFTDAFTRSDGSLDGDNGWSGNAAIATNAVVVTPTLGSELLPDPTFESGITGYTALACALSQSSAGAHGGTYALRVTANGSSNPRASGNFFTVKKRYVVAGYTISDGTPSCQVRNATPVIATVVAPVTWTAFRAIRTAADANLAFGHNTATASVWCEFDDITCKELVDAPVIRTFEFAIARVGVAFTRATGENVDLYVWVDANNWIRVTNLGANSWSVDKCVSGTITIGVTTFTATYSAGALLEIDHKTATTYDIYYNNTGTPVVADLTISDSAFQTATKFGFYSSSAATTFDNFAYNTEEPYDGASGWYVSEAADGSGDGQAASPLTLAQLIVAPVVAGQTIYPIGATPITIDGILTSLRLIGSSGNLVTVDGNIGTGLVQPIDLAKIAFEINGQYNALRNLRVMSTAADWIVPVYELGHRPTFDVNSPNTSLVNVHFDHVQVSGFDTPFGLNMKGCLVDLPLLDAADRAHMHTLYVHWDSTGDSGKRGNFGQSIFIAVDEGGNAISARSASHLPVIGFTFDECVWAHGETVIGNTDDCDDIIITDCVRWGDALRLGYGDYAQQSATLTGSWAKWIELKKSWTSLNIQNNVVISDSVAISVHQADLWDYMSALTAGALDYNIIISPSSTPYYLHNVGAKTLAEMQALGLCTNDVHYTSIAAAVAAAAIPAVAKSFWHAVNEDDHIGNLTIWNYTNANTVDVDLDALGLSGALEIRQCRDYLVDRAQFTVGTPKNGTTDGDGISMDASGVLTIDMRLDTAGGYRTTGTLTGWDAGSAYHPDAVPDNALPTFGMFEVWSA